MIPKVSGGLGDVSDAGDSSVVEENVDSSVLIERGCGERFGVSFFGDVDVVSNSVCRGVDVCRPDCRTFARKQDRGRTADPRPGASYDANLI